MRARGCLLAAILLWAAGAGLAPEIAGAQDAPPAPETRWREEHLKHGEPRFASEDCTLVLREGYALLYDRKLKIARWTAYRLDPEDLIRAVKATQDFREDPRTPGGATPEDFSAKTQEMAQFVPAEDLRISAQVMNDAFYMSNVAPQTAELNRGPWADLEGQVRDWLPSRGQLWVYSGPIFAGGKPGGTIGAGASVPTHFWKVVVDERPDGGLAAIGFLMPNSEALDAYYHAVVPAEAIEIATGIDFLPNVEKDEQEKAETRIVFEDWQEAPAAAAAAPAPAAGGEPAAAPPTPRPTPRPAPEPAQDPDPARPLPPLPEITPAPTPRPHVGPKSIVRRLRRGEQFSFGGVRVRLTRVDGGDAQDRFDDEAELSVVSGTQSSQLNLRELETVFYENYEVTAEEVAASGRAGEGTIRVFIRYVEPLQ